MCVCVREREIDREIYLSIYLYNIIVPGDTKEGNCDAAIGDRRDKKRSACVCVSMCVCVCVCEREIDR